MRKKIIIGARGSKLSLVQANIIKDKLQFLLPHTEIEIKIIRTQGDKDMSPVPLDTVGKGWFTKELDRALLKKTVDIAVHSLKDIPEELPPGLIIAAIPQREDAREALISANGKTLEQLKKGAVVGTDSTRRKTQILSMRSDIIVKSLRGNVNRRLEKLEQGEYDGIFLAVAGLKRLGLADKITQYFDEKEFIPSPGQGALAVVARKNDKTLLRALHKINDTKTTIAVNSEREFSKYVGGGCKMPVGAFAHVMNEKIVIHAVIGSLDGKHIEKATLSKPLLNANNIGRTLATRLLRQCKSWYTPIPDKYVIVTRPDEQEDTFLDELKHAGFPAFSYATIEITKMALSKKSTEYILGLASFDWIIFTSRHGVSYFLDTLKELGIDSKILLTKKIATVGPKTAEAAKKFGLPISFIPTKYTTNDLASQFKQVKGKKMLLARANIATPTLTQILQKKGAVVIDIPIYKTTFPKKSIQDLKKLVKTNKVLCITFTSPSTVEGFLKNVPTTLKKSVLSLPILSIGPVTTKAAKTFGFKKISTAKTHTTEGMISLLMQNSL